MTINPNTTDPTTIELRPAITIDRELYDTAPSLLARLDAVTDEIMDLSKAMLPWHEWMDSLSLADDESFELVDKASRRDDLCDAWRMIRSYADAGFDEWPTMQGVPWYDDLCDRRDDAKLADPKVSDKVKTQIMEKRTHLERVGVRPRALGSV